MRRLGLGLELVGDPKCMVCDEVTSGLDPQSEDQILTMLQRLRDDEEKTFICIIHNLAKLKFFDLITVVYEGAVVFQGSLEALNAYFGIPDALHLYDTLNEHSLDEWRQRRAEEERAPEVAAVPQIEAPPLPSAPGQTCTLLKRRSLLFARDKGYWLLTLGITIGFPVLVAIFAIDGIPQLRGMVMEDSVGFVEKTTAKSELSDRCLELASLVTGLILFQVILLTLMGSNNGLVRSLVSVICMRKSVLPDCGPSRMPPANWCLPPWWRLGRAL